MLIIMKTHKLHSGFGLVEIMIAMVIGLFLLGGIIQMFITSKQTYKMQDTVARLQENQRFALDFLVHDMRGISGWGCFKDSSMAKSLLNSTGTGVYASDNPSAAGTPSPPPSGILGTDNHVSTGGTDPILAGTDTITLRGTAAVLSSNTDVALTTALATPTANLTVSPNSGIKTGDILFLGDCVDGNLFQATAVTTSTSADTIAHAVVAATATLPGNTTASFTKLYDTNTRLYRFNAVTYSIQQSESGQPGLFDKPSLFKQVGNGATTELIEGVENIQILYGEDTDNDGTPNRYLPAGSVTMGNIVSLQVSLLMRSLEDNQVAAPMYYSFNNHKYDGVTVDADGTVYPLPSDKRIRRAVSSIITIRNRLY